MRTILFAILVSLFLMGCEDTTPKYETLELGTVGIKDHKTPHGGLNILTCQFRVEVGGLNLGYAGTSARPQEHRKCLTMKNGDKIEVRKRTRISGKDEKPPIMYFGKAGEVEFILN